MEKKWTGGVWTASSSSVIQNAGGERKAIFSCVDGFCSRDSHEEDYATAHLISAAPELVEALEAIIRRAKDPAISDDTDKLISDGKTALAKAYGCAVEDLEL